MCDQLIGCAQPALFFGPVGAWLVQFVPVSSRSLFGSWLMKPFPAAGLVLAVHASDICNPRPGFDAARSRSSCRCSFWISLRASRGVSFRSSCLLAGGRIRFKVVTGLRKPTAHSGGQFRGAHRLAAQPAQPQHMAAESLQCHGNRSGRGAGIAIERAQRIKNSMGVARTAAGRSRTGPLRRLKLKTTSVPRTNQTDPEQVPGGA